MYFIRSNSRHWHFFLPQYCYWEIAHWCSTYQGHAGSLQFVAPDIYDNPSLWSWSSSITPEPSMAYSGFEASIGKALTGCVKYHVTSHIQYWPQMKCCHPLNHCFFMHSWCDLCAQVTHDSRTEEDTACRLQLCFGGSLRCIWQLRCLSFWSVLPFKKLLHLQVRPCLACTACLS